MKGLFVLLLGIVLLTVGWIENSADREVKAYREYYNKTEELLDSMCASDSAFIRLTETNIYSEYLEARSLVQTKQSFNWKNLITFQVVEDTSFLS